MSLSMARPLKDFWPDVATLLERDGAIQVDVGVGGAGGAIGMAKAFPSLRIVGIDPLPAALVEARANVAANGMQERIELRSQRGDELTEVNHFDTAFVPAKFFDDAAFSATLHTLAKALKQDGAILTAAWRDVGEPKATALSKLRCEMWGAGPRTTEEVTAMLNAAGFREVRVGPAQGAMVPILGKR
jgi:precorrin-6B methylase 2